MKLRFLRLYSSGPVCRGPEEYSRWFGLGADILTTRYGRHLASLPGGEFFARRLNGPSAATLDRALTARRLQLARCSASRWQTALMVCGP